MRENFSIAAGIACAAAVGAACTLWWKYSSLHTSVEPGPDAVKVGILGTGWGLKVQVPQFRLAGLNVTSIYSRSEEKAKEIAVKAGLPNGFHLVSDLCNSSDVQLVSIVTPPYLHLAHFKEAMQAGKHILVDKPLCMSADEAEEMYRLTLQHPHQVAVVDHEMRFTQASLAARTAIRGGKLGKIGLVSVDVKLPETFSSWSWWADESQGGGALGALGSHIIDILRFLLDGEVAAVKGHLSTIVRQLPDAVSGQQTKVTSDDYFTAALVLKAAEDASEEDASGIWGDGVSEADVIQVNISAAIYGKPPMKTSRAGIQIVGSRGSMDLDSFTSTMTLYDDKFQVVKVVSDGANAFAVVGTRALGVALQQALGPGKKLEALGRAATLADGLAVMYVMDAIKQSSAGGGKWVTPKCVRDLK